MISTNLYFQAELDKLATDYYLRYEQLYNIGEKEKASICLEMHKNLANAQRVLINLTSAENNPKAVFKTIPIKDI